MVRTLLSDALLEAQYQKAMSDLEDFLFETTETKQEVPSGVDATE